MPQISVVIPVFDEAENLPVLQQELSAVLSAGGLSYEILYVNDGSRDGSLEVIRSLAGEYPQVHYINFSRNFGHQVAVSAGLDHCKGDAVVIMDADLQDPPALIRALYDRYREGYEVVYARRRRRRGEGLLKRLTASFFYRLMARITSVHIPLDTGDFRIIDRKVVEVLRDMPERHKFLRGQIAWVGFRQTFVEYDRHERMAGESGYSWSRMIRFALDGITAFSDVPLRLVTYCGFLVSGIAFLIALYALYARFILQDYVQGWASLIISVLFIGGIQMIGIGIIGEYISRIQTDTRKRPLYVIDEIHLGADAE